MKEYIEREAAVAICSNQYKECLRKSDWCGDTVAWNICYGIKDIPAADVVERKRGELTYGVITEFENGDVLWYEPITDEINGFVLRTSDDKIICEWVTNCGADMRGEKHEAD